MQKIYRKFEYTGVDIMYSQDQLLSLSRIFPKCRFLKADASNISELLSNIPADNFDMIIMRHPEFVTYGAVFKNIVRFSVPFFLKKNGTLLVSLLHPDEQIYFLPLEKRTLDSTVIAIRYDMMQQRKHGKSDRLTKMHPGAAEDKIMLCFKNRVNTAQCGAWKYYRWIDHDNCQISEINQIKKMLKMMGAQFQSQSEDIFLQHPAYIEVAAFAALNIRVEEISELTTNLIQRGLFSHSSLQQQLAQYRGTDTEAFFIALDAKDYNRALRIACTVMSRNSLRIVEIMMEQRDQLMINPNQPSGISGKNAFHHAANTGSALYDLLRRYVDDANVLDATMKSPQQYLNESKQSKIMNLDKLRNL